MTTRRLLFVCVENSCRSQMAEAFARMEDGGTVRAYSAGSAASGAVNPGAIRTMAELGYDLASHRSKTPADLPELSQPQVVRHFTRLSQMTLGCDVANDIGSGTCTMKHNP